MSEVDILRDELFKLFENITKIIVKENDRILEAAEKVSAQTPPVLPPAKQAPNAWLVLLITFGVICLLGALIIGPVLCCLKKRGAFSSEHVDEDIDFPDEDDDRKDPKQLAISPARGLSPANKPPPGVSPLPRSPGRSPHHGISPARTPRSPRSPAKKVPRGLSPMGLSPMKNRSY